LSLTKSKVVGKVCVRRGTAEGFPKFLLCLLVLILRNVRLLWGILVFGNNCYKIFLKPLGPDKRLEESCQEMSKSYCIYVYSIVCSIYRQFLKSIGKPLGNGQRKLISIERMFLLAGCDENLGNEAISQ
jgi:hypothetical protein